MAGAVLAQVTLILKLVAALLKDEGGRTPLHEIARRRCMQVRLRAVPRPCLGFGCFTSMSWSCSLGRTT
jgi:hypothetical protein